MKILGLSGSPTAQSKTRAAIEAALASAGTAAPEVETEFVNLRDYDVQFCDGRNPDDYEGDTRVVMDKIVACDGLIVGTPMYRGSYTGILKNMFDIIPNEALKNKPVGLIATGGSDHHYLSIEHELKPLMGFFYAHVIPGAVYANNTHYEGRSLTDPGILSRLDQLGRAVVEFARKIPRGALATAGADGPEVRRVASKA